MKQDEIRAAFARFIPQGASVLMQVSIERLGVVDGGADAVIDAALDALGPDGTLMMPTPTGHEALSAHNPPCIDLRTEPVSNGLVSESFRKRRDAIRSVHPTHSVAAIGKHAEELTRDHYLSPTPCGVTSPYFRNALREGYIALIGYDLNQCATFHCVEEIANVPYVCQEDVAHGTCIDRFGKTLETPCRLHRYDAPERGFTVMEPILKSKRAMRIEPLGHAEVRFINAMALIELTLDQLRYNPWFLTKNGEG